MTGLGGNLGFGGRFAALGVALIRTFDRLGTDMNSLAMARRR